MGKITTIGIAKRKCEYDSMIIEVAFNARLSDTKESVDVVIKESEDFLKILSDNGIDISQLIFSNNSVDNDFDDDEEKVEFEREIKIETNFDIKLLNSIMDIIKNRNYHVKISTKFRSKQLYDVHEQLIKEAFEDAKRKANFISEATGQKITGIEKMSVGDRYCDWDPDIESVIHKIGECHNHTSLISEKLKAPYSIEREKVEVEWNIE